MSGILEFNHPYLAAVYCCESDMCVQPIKATAEAVASLILSVGCDSDVEFYTPDGEKVIVSNCDQGIAWYSGGVPLAELYSLFDEMKSTGNISEAYCEKPEIDPDEWGMQYDRYYIPPNDIGYLGPEYF